MPEAMGTAAAQPAAAQPTGMVAGSVPKLDIRDLYISYVDRKGKVVHAVDGVDMNLANKPGIGELVVLLGPSGCGKSTILKAVAGLLVPDSGTILIDGQPVSGTGQDRGMVFQSYTSFAWLTVRENVEYGLKLSGVEKKERRERAMKILEQVGLKDFADAYPKQLSG